MGELRFEVDSETPVKAGDYLRVKKGVSRRLITLLKRIEGGAECGGKPLRMVDEVKKGDVIILRPPEGTPLTPNPALDIPVLYESGSAVVFDKPPGFPVHPSHGHTDDTVGNFFAAKYPALAFRPVNRLDRDTSGLCIAAKDSYSASAIQRSFRKVYIAAVCGITGESGTVDAPIARERIIMRCVREDGQRAVTHYRRIACSGGYSLLRIELETGRTHQIRVHMSHIGHPLAGDSMYGGSMRDIPRHALHCAELSFDDPLTGERVELSSPLPEDIARLFPSEGALFST